MAYLKPVFRDKKRIPKAFSKEDTPSFFQKYNWLSTNEIFATTFADRMMHYIKHLQELYFSINEMELYKSQAEGAITSNFFSEDDDISQAEYQNKQLALLHNFLETFLPFAMLLIRTTRSHSRLIAR